MTQSDIKKLCTHTHTQKFWSTPIKRTFELKKKSCEEAGYLALPQLLGYQSI